MAGGCSLQQRLWPAASEVWGVDGKAQCLKQRAFMLKSRGVQALCRFVVSDRFPDLPEATGFDLVVMKDVLEHVTDDEALLEHAARSLVQGGRLVVSTQNSLSLNYLLEGGYQKVIRGNHTWCGWDSTHMRFYTPMNLSSKLRRAGFVCDSWRSVYIVPYKFRLPRGAGRQFLRVDALALD